MVVYVYDKKNNYKKIHSLKNVISVSSLANDFHIDYADEENIVTTLIVEKVGIKLVVYGF